MRPPARTWPWSARTWPWPPPARPWPARMWPWPARWSCWAPFPARAQESFPGKCVQGGGGVRLELLDLLDRPLGVPVQGAVVIQARGGGHPEQRVALRGGEHAEHRAQAEESQACPAQGAFGGGVAVGPGHHVDAGIRTL